jgi:intracellular sulfur oxidation DsrE/DsrF family protein
MELVLQNAENAIKYYKKQGEQISIEIVVYGPGLHMLRTDTSPVKDRIKELADMMPDIKLSACENTKKAMEKSEGHGITLLPQATTVPSGIVRLSQLQEQGGATFGRKLRSIPPVSVASDAQQAALAAPPNCQSVASSN